MTDGFVIVEQSRRIMVTCTDRNARCADVDWKALGEIASGRVEHYRNAAVEQFRDALLTGLDDLERHNIGRLVSPGDVADLIARVHHQIGGGA